MSTITPGHDPGARGARPAAGGGLLDAPVSGSTATAASGQLTLMVGGDAATLERARPALEALAKSIFHLGPLGLGRGDEARGQHRHLRAQRAPLAEGLVLAEAAGMPRELAYEVIAASAVGAPYVGYKRAAFLDPEGTPVAFALDLAAKDLGLITALADRLGIPVPQARANLALIRAASSGGRGGRDFATVAEELRTSTVDPRAERPPTEEAPPR